MTRLLMRCALAVSLVVGPLPASGVAPSPAIEGIEVIEPEPERPRRVSVDVSERDSIVVRLSGRQLPATGSGYSIRFMGSPRTRPEIAATVVSAPNRVVVLRLTLKRGFSPGTYLFRVGGPEFEQASQVITLITRGFLVVYPEEDWPRSSPADQGMRRSVLKSVPGGMGTAIVIRNGYNVFEYGSDPAGTTTQTWWASCARTIVSILYGIMIKQGIIPGGKDSAEAPVNGLDSDAARPFRDDVLLKHLLGYTSCGTVPGTSWRYSCNWDLINAIARDLTAGDATGSFLAFARDELRDQIGGTWFPQYDVDQAFRIVGSPSDMARLGHLLARRGDWAGTQILPRWFVDEMLSGSAANLDEGWQVHLNTSGHWRDCPTDAFSAVGGKNWDQRFIFAVPSLSLVVARARPQGNDDDGLGAEQKAKLRDRQINKFFGPVCRAVRDQS